MTNILDGENTTDKHNLTETNGKTNIDVTTLIGFLFLILVTCGTNILLIACVWCVPRLRNVTNAYISSLAVADLIVGLIVMTGMAAFTLRGRWTFGWIPCTIWATFDFACCTVSMLHLCVLAYERHLAIVHPLKHKANTGCRRAAILIAGAWVGGILVWAPAVVIFREKERNIIPKDDCFFLPPKEYAIPQAVVVYYMTIACMLYLYAKIVLTLRNRYSSRTHSSHIKHANRLHNFSKGKWMEHSDHHCIALTSFKQHEVIVTKHLGLECFENQSSETKISTRDLVFENHAKRPGENISCQPSSIIFTLNCEEGTTYAANLRDAREDREKQKLRAQHRRCTVTLGVVMATFLICWLPFCLLWPLKTICDNCIPSPAYAATYWMAFCNSTVNPLIYFIVNEDFRKGLKELLKWKTREVPREQNVR